MLHHSFIPVLRIRITLKRIRILLVILMWILIRILLVTLMLMRIRIRILPFTLIQIRIRILDFKYRLKTLKNCSNRLIFHTFWLVICKLMRIRIQILTFTLMRIRTRIRIHNTVLYHEWSAKLMCECSTQTICSTDNSQGNICSTLPTATSATILQPTGQSAFKCQQRYHEQSFF